MSLVCDIVIFGDATLQNVHNMLHLSCIFFLTSRQQINFNQSQIIAQDNLSPKLQRYLFMKKGFAKGGLDLQYLGFPFIKNVRHIATMQNKINKLSSKIDSKNLKPLS